ncbi:MAG TPA: CRISPR-associated helicase Cas3' [Anaerolineales bacterium]|nr:CRISPR-associated helicase Cas3' [Anaerolineales bacterium]
MKPSRWPDWLDDIWAKSADKGTGNKPESLAQHTWDVLARLTDYIELRPELPTQLGKPYLWNSLFWAAFLHDFGKAMPGFQAMLRKEGERWRHRHEVFSLAFVEWIAEALTPEEHQWIIAAIVSHHKDANEIENDYPLPDDDEEDVLAAHLSRVDSTTLHGLWRWINECSSDWIAALGLTNQVRNLPILDETRAITEIEQNGVMHIRKRLKQYRRFVQSLDNQAQTLWVSAIALRGHLINADHSASAHVGRMQKTSLDISTILASRKLTWDKLFEHQRKASQTEGSALLIAPTGSGKTEAALLWASHQAHNGALPRLFYALPYQASMNAMLLRLQENFRNEHVGLQHGRALLAMYRMLMEREYDSRQAAKQARWAKNLAELNFQFVRVFSPYQMLKGMYRLKGYEAMLSDYHNAAFVFDEIHAYEIKRLAMILKAIEYLHRHYHARFMVMSATFPSLIKKWLREALDSPAEISATPDLFQEFQRHRLQLLPGELLADSNLGQIAETARAGKSVLVVCNLVDRAQTAFRELQARLSKDGIPVELLHGRFNMRDRSAKERLIRDATGSTSQNRRSIVLVATQVVEVSLDIDLDTIFTDPAPLEALVQRFGRINRRRKQTDLAPVHVYCEPCDGQKIYDERLVQRTLRILEREDGKPIDESAIGIWLDEIYEGEVGAEWQRIYEEQAQEFEESCLQTLRPFQSSEYLEEQFYCAFDGTEVLPQIYWDEYEKAKEENPIRASELLVPITYKRFFQLRSAKRLLTEKWPWVVDVPYTSEIGLDFSDLKRKAVLTDDWD